METVDNPRRSWYRDPLWRRRGKARTKALAEYGISVDDYERRFRLQQAVCAICRRPETRRAGGQTSRLAVDHDHAHGRVRGLLCYACNTGLGQFRDRPASLIRAAAYLLRSSGLGGDTPESITDAAASLTSLVPVSPSQGVEKTAPRGRI